MADDDKKTVAPSPRGPPHRRRRRKRDSIEMSLFSYVRSQCLIETHNKFAYCPARNCSILNQQCLEILLRSARKSISVAMYQFSVNSLCEAMVYAKEKNNVAVRVIVDPKMAKNVGSTFQEMVDNGEWRLGSQGEVQESACSEGFQVLTNFGQQHVASCCCAPLYSSCRMHLPIFKLTCGRPINLSFQWSLRLNQLNRSKIHYHSNTIKENGSD